MVTVGLQATFEFPGDTQEPTLLETVILQGYHGFRRANHRCVLARLALSLATVATVAGSLLSIVLAGKLAAAFSGKGLVPADLVGQSSVLISIGLAGAITIQLATFLGMPTSTTHALTGALLGVALVASGAETEFGVLWGSFFKPLLISPVLAVVASALLYGVFAKLRRRLDVDDRTCVCVGAVSVASRAPDGMALTTATVGVSPHIMIGHDAECRARTGGRIIGLQAQGVVDSVHALSGAVVCFARAVNDTPKIAALLLATGTQGAGWKLGLVTLAMALGGWLNSRKVAETMGKRIAGLNTGQGLTANLVTAALVLGASQFGVPVSTTHVACGSIFGIGVVGRTARWNTIARVGITWLTTLPMGAALGASFYWCFECLAR